MQCPNCGAQLHGEAKCSNCGAPISYQAQEQKPKGYYKLGIFSQTMYIVGGIGCLILLLLFIGLIVYLAI